MRLRLVVPLALLVLAASCGGVKHAQRAAARQAAPPKTPPATLRRVAQLRRLRGRPLFWLGLRYDGLALVQSDPEDPAPDVTYADCSWTELDTLGVDCHRTIELEEWEPAAGEISTQGRCTSSGRVRGAAFAFFPINRETLRVFTRGTTVEISSRSHAEDLAAARALLGLNVPIDRRDPLPARRKLEAPLHCRAPERKPSPPPTPKQAYERRMQASVVADSLGAVSLNAGPSVHDAEPQAVKREFLADVGTFPILLRHEAERVEHIEPPADAAPLQAELARELRTYADDVDRAVTLVRDDAWKDEAKWARQRDELQQRFDGDSRALTATVAAFRRAGYRIVVAPSGD